ncbi:MAG TPA: cellulase family glycosylhydrolase [Polyangiaceae bacterium]|nr:cellulase family glycosylhydrolase [Polyangiaceae bacterium]
MTKAFALVAIAAASAGCSARTIDAVTAGDAHPAIAREIPDASGDQGSRDQGPVADVPGYHTDGTRILDPSGNPFRIKAVSWYGLEGNNFAPLGLYQLSLDDILSAVHSLGFNTLRMTWSSEMLHTTNKPGSINQNVNPDLFQLTTPLAILDEVVDHAARYDLKIILSRHQSSAGHQDALWWNSDYSPDQFIADWVTLAAHYNGNPTVIGCDLQNDLRGDATWGDGNADTDWKAAAEAAGNAILTRANPAVLILVQGIEKSSDGTYYWRGGNLKDALAHPIKLVSQKQLVYAPQDFPQTANNPPDGKTPPWFTDATYPANLPGVWDANWGYLLGSSPVLLAAFGTAYEEDSDKTWLTAIESYIQGHAGLSYAYWALNAEPSDVNGIYMNDWTSMNPDLVKALQPILGL